MPSLGSSQNFKTTNVSSIYTLHVINIVSLYINDQIFTLAVFYWTAQLCGGIADFTELTRGLFPGKQIYLKIMNGGPSVSLAVRCIDEGSMGL